MNRTQLTQLPANSEEYVVMTGQNILRQFKSASAATKFVKRLFNEGRTDVRVKCFGGTWTCYVQANDLT